jgi:hypothetical protein
MKKKSNGAKSPPRLKTVSERNQSKLNRVDTKISKLKSSQGGLNKEEYLNKAASRITGVSESSLAQGKLGQLEKKKMRVQNMMTPGRQTGKPKPKKG